MTLSLILAILFLAIGAGCTVILARTRQKELIELHYISALTLIGSYILYPKPYWSIIFAFAYSSVFSALTIVTFITLKFAGLEQTKERLYLAPLAISVSGLVFSLISI